MHTRQALRLGSLFLALAILMTLGWAQDRGPAGPKGNAFAPVQKQRAHVHPAIESGADRQRPATDTAYLADDYRHHSLDQDAERAHERRQHRHGDQQPATHQPATTVADAH